MAVAPWLLLLSVCLLFGYSSGCHQGVGPTRPNPFRVTCRFSAGAKPKECPSFQPCVACVSRFGNYYQQCDRCSAGDHPAWYDPLPKHLRYADRVCVKSKKCLTCPICKEQDHNGYTYDPYLGCDGCEVGDDYAPGN